VKGEVIISIKKDLCIEGTVYAIDVIRRLFPARVLGHSQSSDVINLYAYCYHSGTPKSRFEA